MDQDQNPYASPNPGRLAPRSDGSDGAPDASRWIRLGAVLLDGLIGCVCAVPLLFAIPSLLNSSRNNSEPSPVVMAAFVAMGLLGLALLVVNLVMLARHGQTLGKRIVNVRIVRADRSRAGLGRIFWLRMVVPGLIGAIPFVGMLFRLVDPLFIFGEQRRCIHDLIADTRVVEVLADDEVARGGQRAAA
jgi:uncharacterized RDD family membrane protein YckC